MYKNAILFFQAFDLLADKSNYEILCTGGKSTLEDVFLPYICGSRSQVKFLDDADLSTAYSGAIALVYPSKYEGFGLPILEAMQSGCPVIACNNSSIPEVAGNAALYVGETDVTGMRDALLAVQDQAERGRLIESGFANARRFSWKTSGERLVETVKRAYEELKLAPTNPDDPFDTGLRFLHDLVRRHEAPDLAFAMSRFIRMSQDQEPVDNVVLDDCENAIAHMPVQIFDRMTAEIAKSGEYDVYLACWSGLVLQARGKLREALQLYTTVLGQCNWQPDVLWHIAGSAAEIAHQVGEDRLARLMDNAIASFQSA
jgi:hypothetical protein